MKKNRIYFVVWMMVLTGLGWHRGLAVELTRGDSGLEEMLNGLERKISGYESREIQFLEERIFAFRKQPIELEGIIRIDKKAGLSISYPKKKVLIIADEVGVLMRRFSEDGSFVQRVGNEEQSGTIQLMAAALQFDRAVLAEVFELSLEMKEGDWVITMVPINEDMGSIEMEEMHGIGDVLSLIEMTMRGHQKIRIKPGEERLDVVFSEEELSRFFR